MAEAMLLRGAPLAEAGRARISARVAALRAEGIVPCMVVVVASAEPAVIAYAEAKVRTAARLAIDLRVVHVAPADGQGALDRRLTALSEDPAIHGILLEVPVDPPLDALRAIDRIAPEKDIDGLTPTNLGLIASGQEQRALVPATPLACIALAETVMPVAGQRVTVVGRGRSVGRALAPLLTNRDATVTLCHTRTPDLAAAIEQAAIVFTATGQPGLIGRRQVRQGQVVIDAGTGAVNGHLAGDVALDEVLPIARAVTPVPGGVGPVTTALVFETLLQAIGRQRGQA